MPRKEYKTITVKTEAFEKFAKAMKEYKKKDPDIENSTFLSWLLDKYQKSKRART